MDKRITFLHWLDKKFFKTPEGNIKPKLLQGLYWFFHPIEWYYRKVSETYYDPVRGIWFINGLKITEEAINLLKRYNNSANPGALANNQIVLQWSGTYWFVSSVQSKGFEAPVNLEYQPSPVSGVELTTENSNRVTYQDIIDAAERMKIIRDGKKR